MWQLAADAGIAALVLVPLWWLYDYATILDPGSGPQGQEVMLIVGLLYILLMLGIASSGSVRLLMIGTDPWPRRIAWALLPPLGVLLSVPLLWGILDLGMARTGFAARGLAAARSGAGVGLLLWAVFAPWKR